jgi:peptidyl-prolyl cis-trans isomerase D
LIKAESAAYPWLAVKTGRNYAGGTSCFAPRDLGPRRFLIEGCPAMMEALRNGAKTWTAKILLGIVIAVFALLGVSSMDMNATLQGLFKQDLATVGGKVISSEEYQRNLKQAMDQFSQQSQTNITIEKARELKIDRRVLDQMISQAALSNQADRLGVTIGDKAVEAIAHNDPIFKDASGNFDLNRFNSLLRDNGMTQQGYLALERANQLRRTMTGVASDNITLPRTLVQALSRYRDETRDARYVSFTVSEKDVPPPSEDDIKKQYEATPQAYTAPEFRSIAVMKVEPADISAKTTVTDEEIASAYASFKEEYFEPEKRDILQVSFPDLAAAEKAKARVDAGEDLVKIAGEFGQKEKDITLTGKLRTDFIDEKIAEAVFSLEEGKISAPVAGILNTVLLKGMKVIAERQPDLAELTPRLKERLQLQKARDEIQSVYDSVEDARAQKTRFEDIAAKAGLPVIIVPAVSAAGFDKSGQAVSLPLQEDLLKAVYASDVGLDTDALQLGDGYVWFDVREVIPSAVKPLPEVREQVIVDLAASKLRTLAADKAKAIVEKAGNATRLETIATELDAAIKTATNVKRNATSEDFDAIAATALFSAAEKSLTWSLEGDGKSARIIEVSKVNAPTATVDASNKDILDRTKQGVGSDLLDAYMKSAKNSADVVMNEDLWRKISGSTTTQ